MRLDVKTFEAFRRLSSFAAAGSLAPISAATWTSLHGEKML